MPDGSVDGSSLGAAELGHPDGIIEGSFEGLSLGADDGVLLGWLASKWLGKCDGTGDGTTDGSSLGASVSVVDLAPTAVTPALISSGCELNPTRNACTAGSVGYKNSSFTCWKSTMKVNICHPASNWSHLEYLSVFPLLALVSTLCRQPWPNLRLLTSLAALLGFPSAFCFDFSLSKSSKPSGVFSGDSSPLRPEPSAASLELFLVGNAVEAAASILIVVGLVEVDKMGLLEGSAVGRATTTAIR